MGAFTFQYFKERKRIMNKKIFFTDIDGTLLNDAKELTEATKEIIKRLMEKGNILVLISGRPLKSVIETASHLAISHKNLYYVANNGGMIMEAETQKIIMEKRLTFEQTEYLLTACEKAGVHSHTYTDETIVSKRQSKELTFYQKTIHMPSLITEDIIGALDKPPFKCLAISIDDMAKLKQLRESLLPWAEGQVTLIFSNDKLLEMFPADSGKGKALVALSNYLDIPIENTLAAGDQDNDISMLQAAGVGVAMANGASHVKEIADKITPATNNEDGLVPILKSFFEL